MRTPMDLGLVAVPLALGQLACTGEVILAGGPDAEAPGGLDAATALFDAATTTPDDAAPAAAFHGRGEWQLSSEPVSGPSMDLLALRYITIHYNGDTRDLDGADGVYQDDDYAEVLRGMQSSYLSTRGYSLGYNSGIAPDGDEWEIRGLAFRSAANGCTAVNVPGYAIQVTVPDPLAAPTAAQIDGVRLAVQRVRAAAAAAGNSDQLELNGHGDVRPLCGTGGTECPGAALRELIAAGALEP